MDIKDISVIEFTQAQHQGIVYRRESIARLLNEHMIYRRELHLYINEIIKNAGGDLEATWEMDEKNQVLTKKQEEKPQEAKPDATPESDK